MTQICRHTPLGLVDWVYEPRYSTQDFIVDKRIKQFKTELLKIRFSKVNDTNEWAGDWIVSKKEAGRRKFNNNGRECYVISLDKLTRPQYMSRCEHQM